MSSIALVVAVADNSVIGSAGKIPWRIPEDMKHFRVVTLGKPCIMGRKTWESLPRRPLDGRTNLVVTRDKAFVAPGARVVQTLDDAIGAAQAESTGEIAVIGGAEVYATALPRATKIHLTEVHRDFPGDTHFRIDRAGWRETGREDRATPDGLSYSFVTLEKSATP